MANLEVISLLACDAVAFDPAGKVTLYGVFDVIFAKQVPARHPSFAVFCKCRFSTPGEAKFAIYKPDGTPLVDEAMNPIRAQTAGVVQAIYNFAGLELPVVGEYQLRVSDAGGILARVPLTVQVVQ